MKKEYLTTEEIREAARHLKMNSLMVDIMISMGNQEGAVKHLDVIGQVLQSFRKLAETREELQVIVNP